MKHFALNGQSRQVGNKAVIKAFRKQGLVPCNLYGCGVENVLFTVNEKDLKGLLETPYAHIVDLTLDGKTNYTVILHELQFHPVKDNCLHIDFLAVDEKKPIAISVPIKFEGHAIGVQKGGKFVPGARSLRISAKMENLPDDITINISKLDLDKKIKAGDVKLENVSVLTDKDAILCFVKTTRNVDASAAAASEE
ncbi:MAG: 50S ribosomal protein L25 [Bacteroidales bacterium]|jgi:large subunit ribosomal protein L25|nr:50S ribosomal protein L25 [Bacteroidales bacterium]MCR4571865.1 50S ribosomal protein L25 [Bacteroidales bacterium]